MTAILTALFANKKKIKNDEKFYRICEAERANMFLDAIRFNLDDVFSRASIYANKEQLFAADILYHKNCMNRYMLRYKRDLNDATEDNISKKHHSLLQEKFVLTIEELNLKNEGYSVT